MCKFDRYLIREVFVPALVGVVLLLALLIGNQLYILLRAIYAGAPVGEMFTIIVYRLPRVLMDAVPGSLLLGTALSLNRLVRDRELQAMRMAGIRLIRLVAPLLLLALCLSGAMFLLQEKVVPHSTLIAERLTRKLLWGSPTAIIPRDVVFKAGSSYIYVREVDPDTQTLIGAIICKMQNGQPIWATIPRAQNRGGYWFFQEDPRTKEPPRFYFFHEGGRVDYLEATGRDSWLSLEQDAVDYLFDQPASPDAMTLKQILALKKGVRGTGMDITSNFFLTPQLLTFYLHRKIAMPLAALVAVLIAIPLAVRFGRSGGYVGLLLSAAIVFFYVISQQWGQVLAETDNLPPIIAAWAPNGIFGLWGLLLLLWQE